MDILRNTLDGYLVLININIRYAILESIRDPSNTSIISALKSIFKKLKKSIRIRWRNSLCLKTSIKIPKKRRISIISWLLNKDTIISVSSKDSWENFVIGWGKRSQWSTLRFANSSRHTREQYTKQQEYHQPNAR
jgi:hypothetical protein